MTDSFLLLHIIYVRFFSNLFLASFLFFFVFSLKLLNSSYFTISLLYIMKHILLFINLKEFIVILLHIFQFHNFLPVNYYYKILRGQYSKFLRFFHALYNAYLFIFFSISFFFPCFKMFFSAFFFRLCVRLFYFISPHLTLPSFVFLLLFSSLFFLFFILSFALFFLFF